MTDTELEIHIARGKLARQIERWPAIRACELALMRHVTQTGQQPARAVPVKT